MKRVLLDYLTDILDAINDIETFLKNTDFNKFQSDNMRRNAVVRSLEIIGEASRNIPDELRQQYKDIPWKRMAGMRDKLIHGYFGVDYESVWAVATERIPELKKPLQKMIKEQSGKK
ncbi:MAG TPA: DUF86 domain-containing protein [Deltaproteobacteria bacterium]|nr:DUF86 domain-containing protein [Deltaproteobacteria bacterium]